MGQRCGDHDGDGSEEHQPAHDRRLNAQLDDRGLPAGATGQGAGQHPAGERAGDPADDGERSDPGWRRAVDRDDEPVAGGAQAGFE
jgi:hypothetical protein